MAINFDSVDEWDVQAAQLLDVCTTEITACSRDLARGAEQLERASPAVERLLHSAAEHPAGLPKLAALLR
jgi:hypothetical protein